MSAVDIKLNLCGRLVEKLVALEAVQDQTAFADDFANLLNAVGAIRQYVQNELRSALSSLTLVPEQQWLNDLENDTDVATMIGLRNTDVHNDAIQVTHQHVFVEVHSTVLRMSTSFSTRIIRADGTESENNYSAPEEAAPMVKPIESTARYEYHLNPRVLPSNFMTVQQRIKNFGRIAGLQVDVRAGDAFPMKSTVIRNLSTHDLGSISRRAVERLRNEINNAKRRGFLT